MLQTLEIGCNSILTLDLWLVKHCIHLYIKQGNIFIYIINFLTFNNSTPLTNIIDCFIMWIKSGFDSWNVNILKRTKWLNLGRTCLRFFSIDIITVIVKKRKTILSWYFRFHLIHHLLDVWSKHNYRKWSFPCLK